MSVREQKGIFTFFVLWFFATFVLSVLFCPPPLDNELPIVFAVGVAETLLPGLLFLWLARKLESMKSY